MKHVASVVIQGAPKSLPGVAGAHESDKNSAHVVKGNVRPIIRNFSLRILYSLSLTCSGVINRNFSVTAVQVSKAKESAQEWWTNCGS